MQLLCTPKAAAETLSVSRSTVFDMLRDGRLTRVHVPGVRGSKVLVAELERIARSGHTESVEPDPMSDRQRSALNAKCRDLDKRREQEPGTAKEQIYVWATERFGRTIDTSDGLTWQEAHDILDELEERIGGARR